MKTENPNQELEEKIQTIFEENDENYGYRRIQLALKNKGITVNHKKVQRIMRKLGLKVEKFTRKSRRYSSYQAPLVLLRRTLFIAVSTQIRLIKS